MATISKIVNKINELESTIEVLEKAQTISHATYVTLLNPISTLKREYVQEHGKADREVHRVQQIETRLPLIEKASKVLLTLRTALPINGDIDTIKAETAITETIEMVANELLGLIKGEAKTKKP